MATMNISLPEQMKARVGAQTANGRYSNSSDVIRDFIRRAQEREEKIANFQLKVVEARAGGVSTNMPEDITRHVLKRHDFIQD